MKTNAETLVVVLVAAVLASNASAAQAGWDPAGSNQTGAEKVCALGTDAQSEQGLLETLKSCRRGDILDIGWLQTPFAMQLCDFTKAVLYHPAKGSVIACVYTGTRRSVIK